MNKRKKNSITDISIGTASDFFARGKKVAKQADLKKNIPAIQIIQFEDPKDMVKFLTTQKLNLMSRIREKPLSVADLAKKLKRQYSAVSRDIKQLEDYGLVKTYLEINPGHGRKKIVEPISANPINIQAQI